MAPKLGRVACPNSSGPESRRRATAVARGGANYQQRRDMRRQGQILWPRAHRAQSSGSNSAGSYVSGGWATDIANFPATDSAVPLLVARIHSIAGAVTHTILHNQTQVTDASELLARWMCEHQPVRILGAGRALLAGSMPGNRLSHAGAQVSFMGGMVPLPNSALGGGIIACSASGRTPAVLEAMAIAKRNNPKIKAIGIADSQAADFEALCDVFIGLCRPKEVFANPLSALADTEELMIAEILDGLVVHAGRSIGFDDEAWRRGHEDIGPTGPYASGLRAGLHIDSSPRDFR
jgi:D-arabinose 5-phosphate isomerase GutQ